jgi:hypothetical protein
LKENSFKGTGCVVPLYSPFIHFKIGAASFLNLTFPRFGV